MLGVFAAPKAAYGLLKDTWMGSRSAGDRRTSRRSRRSRSASEAPPLPAAGEGGGGGGEGGAGLRVCLVWWRVGCWEHDDVRARALAWGCC